MPHYVYHLTQNPIFDEFDPSQTDATVVLPFCPMGHVNSMDIGIEFIFIQSAPCALLKLIKFTQGLLYDEPPELKVENVTVTFHDARKNPKGMEI